MKLEKCIRVLADLEQINRCRAELGKEEFEIRELSDILNLAGNEGRLKMLYLLQKEEKLCVCDLSDILGMKIPAVSQHLRRMKDGGLVDNEKVGQTIFYFIDPGKQDLMNLLLNVSLNETAIKI